MRVGVGFTPFETRADVVVRLAGRADELGLDRVEVAEGGRTTRRSCSRRSPSGPSAHRPRHLGDLGVGTHAGDDRLAAPGSSGCSAGRFSLGIGAGSPPLTEGFHGIAWERPLLRLRRTLTRGPRAPGGRAAPGSRPRRPAAAAGRPAGGARPDRAGRAVPGLDPARGRAGRRLGAVPVGAVARPGGPGAAAARARRGPRRHADARLGRGAGRARSRRGGAPGDWPPGGWPRTPRGWDRCTRGCWASASAMGAGVDAVVDGRAGRVRPGAAGRGREELAHEVTMIGDLRRGPSTSSARGSRPVQTKCTLVLPPGQPGAGARRDRRRRRPPAAAPAPASP